MSKFYTSDLHFGHKKVIDYCDRPFRTADGQLDTLTMDESLIRWYNEIVGPDDNVYIIGDVAMGDKSRIPNLIRRLNGRKHLILGNHDYRKPGIIRPEILQAQREGLLVAVVTELEVIDAGRKLMLKHEPFEVPEGYDYALIGHVHNSWTSASWSPNIVNQDGTRGRWSADPTGKTVNVGVDVSGYRPMTLDQLLARPFHQGPAHRV